MEIYWLALGIALALCIAAAVIASRKGRSGLGFFLLSVIFTPLIGIIAALIVNPNQKKLEEKQLASGTLKRCPYCAEIVKREARLCRHCGKEFPISESPRE